MTNDSKASKWAGRILTAMVTLILLGSGVAKIAGAPKMVDPLVHAGIPRTAIVPIALLELLCLAVYLIPRTTGLGTLLLTGYFGGATVTHLIGGESVVPPLMIGLMIWAGAYLRLPELRMLLPFRRGTERLDSYRGAGYRQPHPSGA